VAVGTGTGLADLKFPDTQEVKWSLPSSYSGYTDANTVKVLATNPNPKPFKGLGVVYVRGMLDSDLDQATQVAIACYPAGHQHVSADENSTGLVLGVEGKLIGYAVYNVDDSYVADIAVLPEYRRHSTKLVEKLLTDLEAIGGVWTADCRESTSLRLMKAYAKRGRLNLEVGEISHSLSSSNEDSCYRVKFWF
jgi:GNAT superfamily N-acetyltransferase